MKHLVKAILALSLFAASAPPVHAQDDGPGSPPPESLETVNGPLAIEYNRLYASSEEGLLTVDPETGTSQRVGSLNWWTTDIAFRGLDLFGVTPSQLIRIDPATGNSTVVGGLGFGAVTSLAIGPDGTAYSATGSGDFLRVDLTTGRATRIGGFLGGWWASGDLALTNAGVMYAALNHAQRATDWIGRIELRTGVATPLADLGVSSVYGLVADGSRLIAVDYRGDMVAYDLPSGAVTRLRTGSGSPQFLGLASTMPALTGSLTTYPGASADFGLGEYTLEATADYIGGPGVAKVEFLARYDGLWHSLGLDATSPYTATFAPPASLVSQVIQFRIDVTGTDGQKAPIAGGIRSGVFLASLGTSGVIENWIPTRAYLNQRALGTNGWKMCSAASLTMALAMASRLEPSFDLMKSTANTIYPRVLYQGSANVRDMAAELPTHWNLNQAVCVANWGPCMPYANLDEKWNIYVHQIDAGSPVVVGTPSGVGTEPGHFVVGVGYQMKPNEPRQIIAYDPFGKWNGKTCAEAGPGCVTYDINTQSPDSDKGKWVRYDFDKFTAHGGMVLLQGGPVISETAQAAHPSTPPDLVSDEPNIPGTYVGTPVDRVNTLFLPLVRR